VVKKKYGVELHPLYGTWTSMLSRCYNPNHHAFDHYGGRGIRVCQRWRNSFIKFAQDMGDRPDGFTLDRVDNGKGYSPKNCRWASKQTQAQNRRQHEVASTIVIDGVKASVRQHALRLGIPLSSAYREYRKTGGLGKYLKSLTAVK